MVIDFSKISLEKIDGFKGGEGGFETQNFIDGENKIMYSVLKPHAFTGLHTHSDDSEVVYVLSGTATAHYDDTIETVEAGQVHYCPMGHSHFMENLTDTDLVYLAVVAKHH